MSDFTQFDYLLNAFEQASQAAEPAKHGYRAKATALREYVRDLERRATPPSPEAGELVDVAKDAGWRDIESAPKGRKLIVGYPNELGNWRTVMACYYCEGELPQLDDYDDEFAPAGWYEESESHENILATDETPTHWMSLPTPPVLPTKE